MQGIKFNQYGITSILEGRKTMTRRPFKDIVVFTCRGDLHLAKRFSKYKIGETVFVQSPPDDEYPLEITEKEASIFLKITNIKVERLQDISEDDCVKEGVQKFNDDVMGVTYSIYSKEEIKECIGTIGHDNHRIAFQCDIWEKLPYQPPYDWNSNPYVFVYEFEVVK